MKCDTCANNKNNGCTHLLCDSPDWPDYKKKPVDPRDARIKELEERNKYLTDKIQDRHAAVADLEQTIATLTAKINRAVEAIQWYLDSPDSTNQLRETLAELKRSQP